MNRVFSAAITLLMTAMFVLPLGDSWALADSCDLLGNLKSRDTGVPVTIRFKNKSGGYRSIMWLDYDGNPVAYKDLNAGESYTQSTFAGHPWMVTDGPGNCRHIFVASKKTRRFNITR